MCTLARTKMCAHVNDPIPRLSSKSRPQRIGGMVTQKYYIHLVKPPKTECGCPSGGGVKQTVTHASLIFNVGVCGSVGQDAARALGQASFSPMLEGECSIPVRDVGFSPLLCDTDLRAGCRGVSPGTPVCSLSLGYLQNKNSTPNSALNS